MRLINKHTWPLGKKDKKKDVKKRQEEKCEEEEEKEVRLRDS